MPTLLDLGGIAAQLINPATAAAPSSADITWRSELPAHRYEAGGTGEPVWDWWDEIVPFMIATGRAGWLQPHPGHLLAHRNRAGLPALSPVSDRHASDGGVIPGSDLPSVTTELAEHLVEAAVRAARARALSARRRMRANGLTGPRSHMSSTYAAGVLAERDSERPTWRYVDGEAGERDILYGDTVVGTWSREQVPGMGLVWAWYPAGHAYSTGYASGTVAPDGGPR